MKVIKTLVIVSHPEIANSQTQEFLLQGAQQMQVDWHHLDAITEFDAVAEQRLLMEADRIILQFPLYWYAAPASLKQWEDSVLTRNFIYGDAHPPLQDKELGIVVTTGRPLKDFQHGATEDITLDEALAPYRAIGRLAHMKILPLFPIAQFAYLNETEQMQLLIDYQRYLTQPTPDSLANREAWFAEHLQQLVATLPSDQQPIGELVAQTFDQSQAEVEQLQATLQMIKEGEDQ